MEVVRRFGSLTQVEVAGATGLSPATVSNVVRELVDAGLLTTSPTSRNGRRARAVALARNLGVVAGVHIGHRQLRVALSDMSHTVLMEQRMPLGPEHRADVSLDRAARLVSELLDSLGAEPEELLAIGVALPAPIDTAAGVVAVPGLLPGWDRVPVAETLARRLDRPVRVDNDANLGALAELRYGAARGLDDVVYVVVGHGVGAGVVAAGRLLRGRGLAGELGHLSVDGHGPVCRCGNRGCLETFVRSAALLEPLRDSHGNLTLAEMLTRAREGDPGCRRVVADAGSRIGAALAGAVALLDPQRVLVGGELAAAGALLVDPLREALRRSVMPAAAARVEVLVGELGERAPTRGGLALALETAQVAASPSSTARAKSS